MVGDDHLPAFESAWSARKCALGAPSCVVAEGCDEGLADVWVLAVEEELVEVELQGPVRGGKICSWKRRAVFLVTKVDEGPRRIVVGGLRVLCERPCPEVAVGGVLRFEGGPGRSAKRALAAPAVFRLSPCAWGRCATGGRSGWDEEGVLLAPA